MSGFNGVCTVLDDTQTVTARNVENRVHFTAAPTHVDDQYGLGAGSDSRFDVRGIEVEGRSDAIDKNGFRSGVDDGVNGGAKRHGGRDHFIASADSQGEQRQMNRSRTTAHSDGMGCAFVARELLFEALDPSPQPDPMAAQTLDDRRDLGLANYRRPEDQPPVTRANGIAARYRRKAVGFLNWM
jgi:hypothetical protein